MNSGSDIMITVGDTVVSEHMALRHHQERGVTLKLSNFDRNCSKRKWKENIAMNICSKIRNVPCLIAENYN